MNPFLHLRIKKGCFYLLGLGGETTITLFSNGELDTLTLGESDKGLVTVAKNENVLNAGSKVVAEDILDVHNIEATMMAFVVSDDTHTTQVTSSSDHGNIANVELDELNNLASLNVELYSVVDLDQRIRVADSAAIVCVDVRNTLGTNLLAANLAELVLGLLSSDSVDSEATLDVKDQTEVLASLLNGDDIHETSRVGDIGADATVNLDEALLDNVLDLIAGKSVAQTVSEENNERHALASLVGTWGWLGSPHAGKLVQQPVLGRCQALHMLLRTTRLYMKTKEELH